MGNKGQGVMESILALPLIFTAFALLATVCFQSGFYFITSYYGEEALLCAVYQKNIVVCEKRLSERISKLNIFSKPLNIKLRKSTKKIHLAVALSDFRFQKELKLPLESNLQ